MAPAQCHGETQQGVEEQHPVPHQVQTIQICGALHHATWVRDMDTGGKDREANPDV